MSERRIPHLPALDGLRAIAVVAVVAFHAGLLRGGWLGVEIFFVLSGFLITSILVREHEQTGEIRLATFWLRRARRLLPAIVVFLALVIFLALIEQVEIRMRGIFGSVFYAGNWVQIFGDQGYWDEFATKDPAEHLWSLAIEEQVYLLWPIVVTMVLPRFGRIGLARVAATLCGLSWAVGLFGAAFGMSLNRLYLGTDTRCAGFLIGATMALLPSVVPKERFDFSRFASNPMWLGAAAGLVGGALAVLRGDTTRIFFGPLAIVGLASGLVVLLASQMAGGVLTWAPLQAVGRWSYGIYVYHWPIARMSAVEDLPRPARLAATLLVSTALAALSYEFVEQPIRLRQVDRHALAGFVVAGLLACATAVVISASPAPDLAATPTLGPRPSLSTSPSTSPAVTTTVPGTNSTDPDPPPSPTQSPLITASPTAPDAAPTVQPPVPLRLLIVGDSVPALAAEQIVDAAERRGVLIDVFAQPGCVMSFTEDEQVEPERCVKYLQSIPGRVQASDPDIVVLWWGGTGAELHADGRTQKVCSADGASTVTRRYELMLAAVTQTGARPMIATPSPRLDQKPDGPAGTACEVVAISAFAATNAVEVIPVGTFVCPSYPQDCERVPRRDGLHYTDSGASEVADFLLDRVESAAS